MRKVFVEPVELPEPRFRDGLGIRYVRTDTTDDPVEVLRPLWDVGAMQNAIRQRVGRLSSFRQARFVPVRAAEVPRDDLSTIEVISDYLPGYRLSQYLEASHAGALSIETSTAIYILRELLGALALLHESRGLTHGAIGPERILITPKGRVVVADYVLGPAIERLEFTRSRLWREFRIPLPPGRGLPRLDDHADVVQVGVTALALLSGRPLDLGEYPDGLEDLLAALGPSRTSGSQRAVPPPLVGWIKRALAKDQSTKYPDVREARLALEALLSKHNAASGGATALKSLAEAFGRYAAERDAAEKARAADEARKAALAAQAAALEALQAPIDEHEAASPSTDTLPAFTLVTDDAPRAVESGLLGASLAPSGVPVADVDPPVGWRVPEPPPVEETLPTSPLIQIDAAADVPEVEEFDEEVLDLTALAEESEAVDAREAPANAVIAQATEIEVPSPGAETVLQTPAEPPPSPDAAVPASESAERRTGPPPLDGEPEWWVLADPERAVAPTIDVNVPTETLEELVAEFAAVGHVEPPPVVPAEEPVSALEAVLVEDSAPAVEPELTARLAETPGETPPVPARLPPVSPEPLERPAETLEELVAELAALAHLAPASVSPAEEPVPALEALAFAAKQPAVAPGRPESLTEAPIEMAPLVADLTPESVEQKDALVDQEADLVAAEVVTASAEMAATPEEPAEPAVGVAPGPAASQQTEPEIIAVPAALAEAPVVPWQAPMAMSDLPVEETVTSAAASEAEAVPPTMAHGVLDTILTLQEAQAAAQATVEATSEPPGGDGDASAWSFVEELLHHDEKFAQRPAPDDGPLALAAVDESLPQPDLVHEVAPGQTADAFREVPPVTAQAAPAVECAPAAEQETPALPADWLIEVGSGTAAEQPVLARDAEVDAAVHEYTPAIPVEPRPPAAIDALRERDGHPGRAASLDEPPVPEEDLAEPIFPRIAPSVRRVRAEARRRRVARLRSAVARGAGALTGAAVSGVRAVTGAGVSVVSAVGRGLASVVNGAATGSLVVARAISRGVAETVRGAATAMDHAIRGVGRVAAAMSRAAARAGAAAARGAARSARGAASASRALAGAAFRQIQTASRACVRLAASMASALSRGVRAGAGAVLGLAGITFRAATSAVKAGGRGVSAAGRGLAAALGALGRMCRAGGVAAARALTLAARGAGRTLSTVAWGVVAVSGALGRATGLAAGRVAGVTSAAGRLTAQGGASVGRRLGRLAIALPRKAYFAASDLAEHLPRPVFRPWYLGAALLVIAAVAGLPMAKARLFTARPPVGTIRVESARPGALVSIDGVPQGQAPLATRIPAGRHRIEVTVGGRTRTHDVDVSADHETIVEAAAADIKGVGTIRVNSDPAGAEVRVDGVLHGISPVTIDDVTEGVHTIELRDASGTVRQTVRVKADQAVDATVQIRPGWLAVFAPVKLEILENGRSIGSTERGRILAPPGVHTLELTSEQFGFRESRQVEVKPGAVAALTIELPPATIEIVAPAESEILIDGQPVGTAPLEPLRVAVGTREVVMRHPSLGERRQVVSVTYRAPARVVFD